MGIDKIKLLGAVKIIVFFIYLIYFYIFNSNLSGYIPSDKDAYGFKANLVNNKCLLLLGGSNVLHGLSSELLSKGSCEASNLGLSREFGGFDKYAKWLPSDIKSKTIIYSSSIFYNLDYSVGESTAIEIPSMSLLGILKNLLTDPKTRYGDSGDLINYNCSPVVKSYQINVNEFIKSNDIISKEINKRMSVIKNLTHSENIYLRIPPIYVGNKEDSEIYSHLISQRVEILKNLNIKIIGKTIVSTDASLFCDAFHPNAKGREVFTKEIRLQQSMLGDNKIDEH